MFKKFSRRLAFSGLLLAGGVFALSALADPTPPARGEPNASGKAEPVSGLRTTPRIRVIDGDTMEDLGADITYRVVNIDTPETGSRARCAAERALGNRATQEARSLAINASSVEMRPTGRIDRYGRAIAFVMIDGLDFGETLIAEGLARPWRGRREPWCDASGNLLP